MVEEYPAEEKIRPFFMTASAIRELASSKDSTLVAAAMFETVIQIWDSVSRQRVNEFETIFRMGANNLALSPCGSTVVVGRSTKNGLVAAYKVLSGEKLWERRLTYPTSLRFHSSGKSVLCTLDALSVIQLDIESGTTFDVVHGMDTYIDAADGNALLYSSDKSNKPISLVNSSGRTFYIQKLGFALLDAQFSSRSLCLSEAAGPIRCFDSVDGHLIWMFDPGTEGHLVRLHYRRRSDEFFAIWHGLGKSASRSLVRFHALSGKREEIRQLDSWEESFLQFTDQLITSKGDILDLANGSIQGQLSFPMRNYSGDRE